MIDPLTIPAQRTTFQDFHPVLPKMANLFVDELMFGQSGSSKEPPLWLRTDRTPKTVRVPLDYSNIFNNKGALDRRTQHKIRNHGRTLMGWRAVQQQGEVRNLIKGISHHFNNLLMGIWGNLSLLRLNLNPDESNKSHILDEMEALIQDGAYLIHLILGFLGERRLFAQRVRLKQLSKEIQVLLKKKEALNTIVGRLEWTSLSRQPKLVTSSTAMIIEQLLEGIKALCREYEKEHVRNMTPYRRMDKMVRLVDRGLQWTFRMRCSTGNVRLKKRWINPHYLIKEVVHQVTANFSQVRISLKVGRNLPLILVDRVRLKFVLEQLVDNACGAMAGKDGELNLNINLLQEEPPTERFGINHIGNCLVISVNDNGCGIDEASKPNIFDPFFTKRTGSSSVGLGLSASRGLVRLHGGSIHVQSINDGGSRFKLYLPMHDK